MNPPYHHFGVWDGCDEFSWAPDHENFSGSYEAESLFQQQTVSNVQASQSLFSQYAYNAYDGLTNAPMFDMDYTPQHFETYQEPSWPSPSPGLQSSAPGRWWPDIFDKVPPYLDPLDTRSLQRQTPRFEGDLYTAPYVRGEGVERAGWCGFCSSWHKLKDSAFWYHMHYTHGISCQTGRQLTGPQMMQWNFQLNGWQALCARCTTWLTLGKGDKAAKTAYYRHAYQCQVKRIPQAERSAGVKKSRSPRRLVSTNSGHFAAS